MKQQQLVLSKKSRSTKKISNKDNTSLPVPGELIYFTTDHYDDKSLRKPRRGVVLEVSNKILKHPNIVVAPLDDSNVEADGFKNILPRIREYLPGYSQDRIINLVAVQSVICKPGCFKKVMTTKDEPLRIDSSSLANLLGFRRLIISKTKVKHKRRLNI